MNTFKELKEAYELKAITQEQFDEIAEHDEVFMWDRNGGSGLYEDCMWFTVYSVENEEFDFYVRIN